MDGWALWLCGGCLAAAIALFWIDERERQHDLLRMQRMRSGPMYRDLYPLVEYVRRHDLDRVQVERNRVIFYGVSPAGKMGEFILTDWNYRPLDKARTRALALVLAEDLPLLKSNAHYRLRRYKVVRPNGVKDDGYMYTIRPAYKTALAYAKNRVRLY